MKKFIAMLLALTMVLSFVACGNNNNVPENNNDGQETSDLVDQTEPAKDDKKEETSNNSKGITLEKLMKAKESPESDFECLDQGDGTMAVMRYVGNDEIVVIPDTWNGKEITTISSYVFSNDSPVKAIRLSDSVSTLMLGAFGLNASLEIVVCGSGLTTIEEGVFQECTSLHTVVLNDGLQTIRGVAFGGCVALDELEIPASVTEIQPMTFFGIEQDIEIIGEAGSAAETHAASEGIAFKAK